MVDSGRWVRFKQYEIRRGVITPVKRDFEEYDPWHAYYALKGKRDRREPPYQSLLRLARSIYPDGVWSSPYPLAKERETLLLDWCNRNGLLGILLEYVHLVNLYPAHLPRAVGEEPDLFYAYVRRGAHWGLGDNLGPLASRNHREPYVVLENFAEHADVLDGGGPAFDIVIEPLNKTWHRFFPRVRSARVNSYHYPFPGSLAFWRSYGEPVEFFLQFVRFFYKLAEQLQTQVNYLPSDLAHLRGEAAASALALKRETAARSLARLTANVSPYLEPQKDASYGPAWKAPSLLSHYAMMLHQDMLGGRRVIQCEKCGNLFVSGSYQATFCSVACRNTIQKRRLRKKMKEAAKLHSDGASIHQIAKRLEVDEGVIGSWIEKTEKST